MSSASVSVESAPMALAANMVMTVSATVSRITVLSVNSVSTPLVISSVLSQVRVPTPVYAALPLPRVSAHLISFAEVAYEADVIRSDL